MQKNQLDSKKNFIYEGDILKITFLNYIDNTTYIHNFEHKFLQNFAFM